MKERCGPKKVFARTEAETPITLDIPAPKTVHCAATITIAYTQKDTVADVAGTITNADCAACSGEYEVTVNVRDDQSAGLKTLKFVESWQRSDDQPVSFEAQYPIGQKSDLVSVRTRPLRCTCVASQEE